MITEQQMHSYYEDIAPRLTSFLVANGTSYDQACDLVQETFIRIWQKRSELTQDDSISGLAFRIAKNLRIDDFRKAKREILVDEYEDSLVPTVENPAANERHDEYIRDSVTKALMQLPEDYRICYTLYNLGELSVKEISAQLNISESLVKVRIHRAKEKLSGILSYLKEDVCGA